MAAMKDVFSSLHSHSTLLSSPTQEPIPWAHLVEPDIFIQCTRIRLIPTPTHLCPNGMLPADQLRFPLLGNSTSCYKKTIRRQIADTRLFL